MPMHVEYEIVLVHTLKRTVHEVASQMAIGCDPTETVVNGGWHYIWLGSFSINYTTLDSLENLT